MKNVGRIEIKENQEEDKYLNELIINSLEELMVFIFWAGSYKAQKVFAVSCKFVPKP